MKILECLKIVEKENDFNYEVLENFIYKNKNSGVCFLKLKIEREDDESDQYPLESILDLFDIEVDMEEDDSEIVFEGELKGIKSLMDCVGKRIFEVYTNKYFVLNIEKIGGQERC